ncbi:MAG: Holliday junction branch migration protein RuvA, partial [Clostridia bacterium]|nr:Holliday junction branch migration protein RuvA [Clostridia bacterium]
FIICFNFVTKEEGILVLKSGEVGFELCVSDYTAMDCNVGDYVQIYAYLQVKEDGLVLYGFSTLEEKKIFLQLITVGGIGCKMACSVLSNVSVNELAMAIFNGDAKRLACVKCIGKKTAERIVLELKEKIVPPTNAKLPLEKEKTAEKVFSQDAIDAISVLVSLGIAKNDAEARVGRVIEQGYSKAEDLINFALKNQR